MLVFLVPVLWVSWLVLIILGIAAELVFGTWFSTDPLDRVNIQRGIVLNIDARGLYPDGTIFTYRRNMWGFRGGEIDPALSRQAGTLVTIAGVPRASLVVIAATLGTGVANGATSAEAIAAGGVVVCAMETGGVTEAASSAPAAGHDRTMATAATSGAIRNRVIVTRLFSLDAQW